VITNKKFDVIHHLYNFNSILKETLKILDIPIHKNIKKYTIKELTLISRTCEQIHYKYGLGVCLSKEVHKEFHSLYGTKNNTKEQFEEFKMKALGEKQ